MSLGGESHCINHPDVPAVGRCRHCRVPYCTACQVKGPNAGYCSVECLAKHKRYANRADDLDRRIAWARLSGLKLVFIAAFAGLAGATALHFAGVDVPVISEIIRRIAN